MNVWFLNTDEGLIWMEAEAGGKITIRETLYFFEGTVSRPQWYLLPVSTW